jgi:hypothetical protein
LILLLSNTGLAWQTDPNDELNAKLGSTVQQYSLDTKSYLSGLLTVAKDFHLPMGIEWQKMPSGAAPAYTHTWREVSVGTILQDVVNSQPGYQLDTTNGVVHIRIVSLRDDSGNVLNIRIPEFEVHGEYVGIASRRLRSW